MVQERLEGTAMVYITEATVKITRIVPAAFTPIFEYLPAFRRFFKDSGRATPH
jgi:hypothetical protein